VTQNPTYCSKCHTTRPPLLAGRTYTCVMCGKTRSPEEYRTELAKLRRAAEKAARAGGADPATAPPAAPQAPAPAAKAPPAPKKAAAPAKKAAAPAKKAAAPAKKAAAPAKKAAAPAKKAAAPAKKAAAPAKKAAAPTAEGEPCAWKDCENITRPKSKYCSRTCSNRNARYRHAKRRTRPDGQPSA